MSKFGNSQRQTGPSGLTQHGGGSFSTGKLQQLAKKGNKLEFDAKQKRFGQQQQLMQKQRQAQDAKLTSSESSPTMLYNKDGKPIFRPSDSAPQQRGYPQFSTRPASPSYAGTQDRLAPDVAFDGVAAASEHDMVVLPGLRPLPAGMSPVRPSPVKRQGEKPVASRSLASAIPSYEDWLAEQAGDDGADGDDEEGHSDDDAGLSVGLGADRQTGLWQGRRAKHTVGAEPPPPPPAHAPAKQGLGLFGGGGTGGAGGGGAEVLRAAGLWGPGGRGPRGGAGRPQPSEAHVGAVRAVHEREAHRRAEAPPDGRGLLDGRVLGRNSRAMGEIAASPDGERHPTQYYGAAGRNDFLEQLRRLKNKGHTELSLDIELEEFAEHGLPETSPLSKLMSDSRRALAVGGGLQGGALAVGTGPGGALGLVYGPDGAPAEGGATKAAPPRRIDPETGQDDAEGGVHGDEGGQAPGPAGGEPEPPMEVEVDPATGLPVGGGIEPAGGLSLADLAGEAVRAAAENRGGQVTQYGVPLTARGAYVQRCEQLRMVPEPRCVVRGRAEELDLSHFHVGNKMADAMATGLALVPQNDMRLVTRARLQGNNLDGHGAVALLEQLGGLAASANAAEAAAAREALEKAEQEAGGRQHGFGLSIKIPKAPDALLDINAGEMLRSLDLSDNRVGEDGCEALRQMLVRRCCRLRSLNLSRNLLGESAAAILCSGLKVNNSVQSLDLSGNKMAEASVSQLGLVLVQNFTLTQMDVSWNNIRGRGAINLLLGMEQNYHLVSVNLSFNSIGSAGSTGVFQLPNAKAKAKRGDGASHAESDGDVAKMKADAAHMLAEEGGGGGGGGGGAGGAALAKDGPGGKKGHGESVASVHALADYFEHSASQQLRHLDLAFNQLNAADVEMIAEGLQHNTTLAGLYMAGNAGEVDVKGFLHPVWGAGGSQAARAGWDGDEISAVEKEALEKAESDAQDAQAQKEAAYAASAAAEEQFAADLVASEGKGKDDKGGKGDKGKGGKEAAAKGGKKKKKGGGGGKKKKKGAKVLSPEEVLAEKIAAAEAAAAKVTEDSVRLAHAQVVLKKQRAALSAQCAPRIRMYDRWSWPLAGWREVTFVWTPGVSGEAGVDPKEDVCIHLSYDGWEPDLMPVVPSVSSDCRCRTACVQLLLCSYGVACIVSVRSAHPCSPLLSRPHPPQPPPRRPLGCAGSPSLRPPAHRRSTNTATTTATTATTRTAGMARRRRRRRRRRERRRRPPTRRARRRARAACAARSSAGRPPWSPSAWRSAPPTSAPQTRRRSRRSAAA
jgi:hypothetical protein